MVGFEKHRGRIARILLLKWSAILFVVTSHSLALAQTSGQLPLIVGTGINATTVDSPDANVRQLARSIFGDNVFAFELTSVLLLVAVVGTVLMARRARAVEGEK